MLVCTSVVAIDRAEARAFVVDRLLVVLAARPEGGRTRALVLETVLDALGDGRPIVLLPMCGQAGSDLHDFLFGSAANSTEDPPMPSALAAPTGVGVTARSAAYRR